MSKRRSIEVPGLEHVHPIPNASRIGPFLMTGGIYGKDPQTGQLAPDIAGQCHYLFVNIRRVLEAGGAFADSVVAHAQLTLKSDYLLDVAHSYIAFEQHRYAESLRAAQQATAIAPDSAAARLFAAWAWAALGSPDSARAALRHIPPGHPLRAPADSTLATLMTPSG